MFLECFHRSVAAADGANRSPVKTVIDALIPHADDLRGRRMNRSTGSADVTGGPHLPKGFTVAAMSADLAVSRVI